MLLTLACTFVACTQPLPSAPDDALFLAQGTGGVSVAYFCGNTFQFRNRSQDSLTVQWRVHGVQENGELLLAARGGAEYSEAYLTTHERGPLQVSQGGQVLATVPNKHTPQCEIPVTDTTIPLIPSAYNLPRGDSVKTFSMPNDTSDKGYRQYFELQFQESIDGPSFNAFLREFQATIVGGSRIGRTYILRFPDPGPTYQDVFGLLSRLRGDPRVKVAGGIPYSAVFSAPNGLRPSDGPLSQPSMWMKPKLSDDLWSYNAVRAPLAWGCQTGSPTDPVSIGIVDYLFDNSVPDLAPGSVLIEPDPGEVVPPSSVTAANLTNPVNSSHGTGVAGVLGAVGSNNTGLAGLIWNRALRLHTLARGTDVLWNFGARFRDVIVPDLIQNHTRILVVSLTYGRADEFYYPSTRMALEQFLQSGGILVMPNENTAPRNYNLGDLQGLRGPSQGLLRAAAELYPQYSGQIWFVLGVGRDGKAGSYASRYSGIEAIAAPGTDVLTLVRPADFGGLDTRVASGSSFAAPMVAGAAALMLSTDPTMTGPELLSLLRTGALLPHPDPFTGVMEPPKPVDGVVPFLDVYSALQLASRRPDVPLCGNRLWSVGNAVYAERGSGPELVGKVSADVGQVLPYHGGRKVLIQKGESARFAVYELGTTGVWDSTGLWNKDSTGLAGSGLSAVGIVHDRDSLVSFGSSFAVQIGTSYYDPSPRLIGRATTGTTSASGETCVVERKEAGNWRCDVTVFLSETATGISSTQVTPVGDTRLLWAQSSDRFETAVQSAWLDCWSGQPANENSSCRYHERTSSVTHLGSSIWEMSRAATGNGVASKVLDIPDNRIVASVTASEDGGSIAITTGASFIINGGLSDCRTQFYAYDGAGQLSASGAPLGYGASCTSYNWQGGFGAVRQELAASPAPSNHGFTLKARLARTVRQ